MNQLTEDNIYIHFWPVHIVLISPIIVPFGELDLWINNTYKESACI
jgi:hypothetical protein